MRNRPRNRGDILGKAMLVLLRLNLDRVYAAGLVAFALFLAAYLCSLPVFQGFLPG